MVLNKGNIVQYDEPKEIIASPSEDFVKDFIIRQLEIKRNNILDLFNLAAGITNLRVVGE